MEHPEIPGVVEWKPLARGGLAVVWQARQLSLDRPVAVKVYQRELDEGDRRRFLREAAAAGRLSNHPGIVTAYDAGILPDDRPYLMMELCPGGSLTRWLKAENRPSEERVRQVGVEISDALAAAHACGVLHRDVKPANILIDSYGNPRLADFGVAAVEGAGADAAEALGVTPTYAPPEAFRLQPATEFGDVFSLAATLYALLAGSPPRSVGATLVRLEQMVAVAETPIAPIPGVARNLMDVLMGALSNDPAARPTASGFGEQLAKVPAPTTLPPGVRLGAEDAACFHSPRRRSAPRQSATSNSPGSAVTAGTVDSQPSQVAAAEAPPSRGKRRVGVLALAAALITVTAPATAWLISDPASSAVPTAITPFTTSSYQSATVTSASTGSSSPSAAAPVAARAEHILTNCQAKVRAGDTVIKRAKVGVNNLSERVQAQANPNSGRISHQEAQRILTATGVTEPKDVRRYKAAVKAYVDHRQLCQQVPDAPIEIATQLRKSTRCVRAQEPVLAAAADLLAAWESHHAKVRRSRTDQLHDADSVLIRTWIATAPHITAWNKSVAKYHADKC